MLLVGLSVVGAAQDAIDGYYVTAGARVFEVLVLTLGIVVGIGAVLAIAQRSGGLDAVHCRHAAIRQHRGPSGGRDGGFGNVRGVGMGPVAASSLAALTAGFLSQLGASRLRVPALALSTAAIVPLLPGLAVYRGLFEIVQRSPGEGLSTGLTTLFGAAGVGMGLAAGVSLGTFLARPLRAELDRGQRRALRRSAGDARE